MSELIPSSIPNMPPRRIKRGWMNLRVSEIIDDTHDTKTFYLQDADEGSRPFDFSPGQYLTFRFDDVGPKPLVRSYSMSGSPCEADRTIITVKRVEQGIVSNWMCDQWKVGSIARARGPIGKFVYDAELDAPQLFLVAAGSGVTPFTSMIREYAPHLGKSGAPKSIHLLVAHRSQKDLINWRDLEPLHKIRGVEIVTTLTRERADGFWYGRPDDVMIEEFIHNRYQDASFMTCGPQAMMDLVKDHLIRNDVRPDRVKMESFFS